MDAIPENEEAKVGVSQDSQTASEFINQQLALEADAREVLPYVRLYTILTISLLISA